MENQSNAKRNFKKGIDAEDNRRRREQTSIKLRKEKKEEGIAKKRNILMNNFVNSGEIINSEVSNQASVTVDSKGYTIDNIPELMRGLVSDDINHQIHCLRGFRRLLSIEKNPPVQQCIDCGAIPYLVAFLQRHDNHELQFEAAWALTNIASTDRTRLIVECNAIPHLVALLNSSNPDIREQSAWCLGNVAGDGADLRDIVLSNGALEPLLANINHPASLSLLKNCTWSLSNMCRGKPQVPLQMIRPALPILSNLILQNVDQEIVIDATWALSYISDGEDKRIQAVVELGVVPHFINMLTSGKIPLIVPALRTLGNIVSGNDSQTQTVLDANVLAAIVPLFGCSKKNIRKEACWMLSNIAAGNSNQLNSVFNTPELIPRILSQLSSTIEWEVRKEAAWVISNISTAGNKNHVVQLVEMGVIRPICELLEVSDAKILMIAMEALESVLDVGLKSSNQLITHYLHLVDEAGGVDHLEQLQEHENNQIYEKAVKIIEKFFGAETEEPESENVAPTVSSNNTFQFGISQSVAPTKTINFSTIPSNNQGLYQFNF
eukprot:gene12354-16568_t